MSRLDTLDNLADELSLPRPHLPIHAQKLEEAKALPLLGAEIEVAWKAVLDDYDEWFSEPYKQFCAEKKEAFNKRCDELDAQLQPFYEATIRAGIPKDDDGYHEFAHEPAGHYQTLSEEIGMLLDADLIPEGHQHPLHLTISDLQPGSDVGVLASITQLYGGSTPERLTSPQRPWGQRTWADKGTCGIKPRPATELTGGYQTAIELRTLVATNKKQVRDTLRCAQLLATSITNPELNHVWEDTKTRYINDVLKPHGLNTWFRDPTRDKTQWRALSNLYDDESSKPALAHVDKTLDTIEAYITKQQEPDRTTTATPS